MSAVQAWAKFLSHSLASRLDPETFESYVQILSVKQPLSPANISDVFLRPTEDNNATLDPRIPRYLQSLLRLELLDIPAILKALQKYSTFGIQDGNTEMKSAEAAGENNEAENPKGGNKRTRWANSYAAEEMLFYRMAKYISSGTSPKNTQEGVEMLLLSIQWMELVTTAGQKAHEILNLDGHNKHAEINATTMALGTLIVALVDNPLIIKILSKGTGPKGTGKELGKTLASFVPLLLQSSPQSAARLELFRTQALVALEPIDKKEIAASKEIDEMLGGGIELGIESLIISELPAMNSRSGLYIYLNSLVCAPSLLARIHILILL